MNKILLLASVSSALMLTSISANATAITDVSEIAGYTQMYQLDIQNNADYNGGPVAYGVDNSGSYAGGPFDRISYYMELQKPNQARQWVWVSMDAFTQDLTKIAIPKNGTIWQQQVANMTVESNVAGIVTGTGMTTGNIEIWDSCYATANGLTGIGGNSSTYDFNDTPSVNNCYGSFQVHNWLAQQTLLAYNAFEYSTSNDLGIGNQGSGNPDWTFANNAASYQLKSLEVWVTKVPEPAPLALLGLGLIGLGLARRRRT